MRRNRRTYHLAFPPKRPKSKKVTITDEKILCTGCKRYALPGEVVHRPLNKTYRHFGRCPK